MGRCSWAPGSGCSDRGETWEPISELGRVDFHILQVAADRVIAVRVKGENVEVSTDGGRTFEVRTPPGQPVDVAFDPRDPSRMVVTTEQGIFTSSDDGRIWRPRDNLATEQLAWGAPDELYRSIPAAS